MPTPRPTSAFAKTGSETSVSGITVFRWAIIKFNLHTPGREDETDTGTGAPSVFDEAQIAAEESTGKKRAQDEGRS